MSDYTPTTEEVRRAHWRGTAMRSTDGIRENAAFDRWLESIMQKAHIAERERIIKLLKEEADICYGLGFRPGKRLLDVIIDRIKGENK